MERYCVVLMVCYFHIFIFFFLLSKSCISFFLFFFQAEDGIRDPLVTGVQTCALPIWAARAWRWTRTRRRRSARDARRRRRRAAPLRPAQEPAGAGSWRVFSKRLLDAG